MNMFSPLPGVDETIIITLSDPDVGEVLIELTSKFVADEKRITSGRVELCNRDMENTSIYAMDNIAADIHYNESKEICVIALNELDHQSPTIEDFEELERFLSLSKDEAAIKAYRFLSWYWTAGQIGYAIASNTELLDAISSDLFSLFEEDDED